jgi:glycosyltransferase involved in cell wall biosynthesis
MRVIGICKIRNEERIMKETLDHWEKICTGGIYVYDDCSDDKTIEICENHPAVRKLIKGTYWDPERERAEHVNRQRVLDEAKHDAKEDDWFVYFDADERLYFDSWELLFEEGIDAIACKLYDIYITPEDVDKDYLEREWVGPESRTITFFFKNSPYIGYDKPDQRIVNLGPASKVVLAGIVKHFGKGLSVEHWEETVDYYVDFWPKYAEKWKERRGKAIKKDYKSDFGNKLIKFKDVLSGRDEGISLEAQTYGNK